MKDLLLTEPAQQVLKNFSIINSQVCFKKGHILQVLAPGDNILAEARFNKALGEFKQDFCIYEINKLLAILGLVGGTEIDYTESMMTIKQGKRSSIIYEFASPEAIKRAPYTTMPQPEPFDKIIGFDVNTFIKAISILELQTVSFEPTDTAYRVYGSKKTSKNRYEVEASLGESKPKNKGITTVDIEKFKLYNCNKYDITICEQLIRLDAKPEDTDNMVDITYWVAGNEN